jgi:IS30 family transposase
VIGTLVERSTRYVMLLHLPDGGNATAARDALITTLGTLPTQLRRSLTWDRSDEHHATGWAAHRRSWRVCVTCASAPPACRAVRLR